MKIENQVCTLEQAKKLKELGVIQQSYLYWWHHFRLNTYVFSLGTDDGDDKVNSRWSAFTVAELGVMLCGNGYLLPKTQAHFGWLVIIENKFYPTEAQARAAMAIHLLTNKIITAQEVNERLLQS